MSVIVHKVNQGSKEWLDLRQRHLCASEAPAMMGTSKYTNRKALLLEKITGERPAVDAFTQKLFDAGHDAEAEARAAVEVELQHKLTPAVLTKRNLLASLDGITDDGALIWEHKLHNANLKSFIIENDDLPDSHWPQVEQQLYVSGANSCLFTISDGTPFNMFHHWYSPKPGRLDRLLSGWEHFVDDMANTDPDELRTIHRVDEEWSKVAAELHYATQEADLASTRVKELQTKLKLLAGEQRCQGNGVTVYPVERSTIDHKQIIKTFEIDTTPYTRKTVSWAVRVDRKFGEKA